MRLRKLNSNGLARFDDYLTTLRVNGAEPRPASMLTDPSLTVELEPAVEIEQRQFQSRFECAAYLNNIVGDLPVSDSRDAGLWVWLTLLFFDQVCPVRDGKRKVGETARYLPQLTNYKKFYRHLLLGPLMIYRAHLGHEEEVRGVLMNPISSPGDIAEQLASRQELITNCAVMGAATRLYVDKAKNRLKTGAGGKADGSPRRLADFLNQVDLNFDLYAMQADDLIALLPKEFERFRN